jgi:hypothetical protein
MMVPSDGKFFFANDVLHGGGGATVQVPTPAQPILRADENR